MPTTLSVYDAKAKFSSVLANVEEKRVTVTILRYGHPIAQIVPIRQKVRSLSPDPALAGKVKVNCDLFADDSSLWEACREAGLLDTCAVLWLAGGEADRFSDETLRRIRAAEIIYVSPITEWEIALKWRNGGIELPVSPREFIARFMKRLDVKILPLSEEVMFCAVELPDIHRDPADRFIIATALVGNIPVVTADRRFAQYGVETLG